MATDYTDDANCQGAWLFDDDLTDESGEGNTLTDGGSIAYSTTRPDGYSTGKSAQFDGSSDQLSITNADLGDSFPGKGATQDFSYAFWFYCTNWATPSDWRIVFEKVNGWRCSFKNSASPYDNLNVYHYDSGWGLDEHEVHDTFSANTWYHVVCVFDGDGTDTDCKFWVSTESSFGDVVNGETYEMTGIDSVQNGGGGTFYIGGAGGSGYYIGYLYQPIIFNDVLGDAEAEEIYDYGITGEDGAGAGGSIVPMVSYYQRRRRYWMGWQKKNGLWLNG